MSLNIDYTPKLLVEEANLFPYLNEVTSSRLLTRFHFIHSFPKPEELSGRSLRNRITVISLENEVTLPGGNIYKGPVKEGKFHGWGTLTFPNEKVCKGFFCEGELSWGHIYFSDGYSYKGAIKNWEPEGFGELQFLDKNSYIGHFEEGEMQGFGELSKIVSCLEKGKVLRKKICYYRGNLVKELKEGFGAFYNNSGQELFTRWRADIPEMNSFFLKNPLFLASLLEKKTFPSCMGILSLLCSYWKENRLYPEIVSLFETTLEIQSSDPEVSAARIFAGLYRDNPEPYLITIGTLDHVIMLEIVPDHCGIIFKIYNAGKGLQFHDSKPEESGFRYQTMLQIRVPKEKVTKSLLQNLLSDYEFTVEEIYRFILDLEGAEKVESENPIWQKAQQGSNCVLKSLLVFLLQMLGREGYYKMRIDLFEACIKEIHSSSDLEAAPYLILLQKKRDKTEEKLKGIVSFSTKKRKVSHIYEPRNLESSSAVDFVTRS